MPQLVNPSISAEKLPFQFGSDIIFKVVFALYTNKNNKDINPANVDNTNRDRHGHQGLLRFSITGSPDIESSLRKVDMGRIDGWIMAMPESDMALKKADLKNVQKVGVQEVRREKSCCPKDPRVRKSTRYSRM